MDKSNKKIIKKSKDNNRNTILYKYFLSIILSNRVSIIFAIINLVFTISAPLIFYGTKHNYFYSFYSSSILILAIPIFSNIILVFVLNIMLFSKTKTNNIDLFLYSSSYQKISIVLLKQLSIFTFSLASIVGIIINFITNVILGINLKSSIFIFIGNFIGLIVLNIIFIIVFSFVATYLSYLGSVLVTGFLSVLLVAGPIIPILIQNEKKIDANFDAINNKNNLVKIYSWDPNNSKSLKKTYVIYENALGRNNNEINDYKSNFAIKYSPFNFLYGIQSPLTSIALKNQLNSELLSKVNTKYSLLNIDIQKNDFNLGPNSSTIVTGFYDKTVFDYNSNTLFFNAISNNIKQLNSTKRHLNNSKFWKILLSELKSRNQWDPSKLSSEQKNIITEISGINSNNNLYTIFDKYSQISNKISDLRKFLLKTYNSDFVDFVFYIWSNHNVKLNIYSYKALGDYQKIYRIHPQLKTYDVYEKANQYDINFIKNKLFNVVENNVKKIMTIQMLNRNEIYEDVSNYQNIFGKNISTKEAFNEYIENNSTINNLQNILRLASSSLKDGKYNMQFRNNVDNYLVIRSKIKVGEEDALKYGWIYLFLMIFISVMLEMLMIRKYKTGDLI